jgi:4-hydroxybenzoyl-CoA reductase subunit beta
MMRLPSFEFRAPREVSAAAALLAASPDDTMVLGGGTDLLPNMKRRQQTPRVLVSLRHIDELRHVNAGDEATTVVGAGVTLSALVANPGIRESCRGLWQAAAQVATPHLRNMGTIGGNLCLDTRCTYYDQSAEWRKAIGYCMKKDGDTCWVATSSPKCLAVSSTDTAPALMAIGARVRLVSAAGERTIAVEDLFHNDGMRYLTRRPDEILTEVIVPDQAGWTSRYWKVRRRGSFDFPTAAVAVAIRRDAAGVVMAARVALGAVSSRPLASSKAAGLLVGHPLTDDRIAAAAEAAYELAKPMDNTDFTLVWRKRMVRALAGYALRDARGDDMRAARLALARQLL